MKKKALICGASMGIGKAIANLMAANGIDLLLLARSTDTLEKFSFELKQQYSISCDFIAIDLAESALLEKEINTYLTQNPLIHILVNNSGGPKSSLLSDVNNEDFIDYFRSHLIASQILTKYCLPLMQEANFGRIINIVSTSIKQPIPFLGASNTIRGAMNSWAKSISREIGPSVTINNVCPGFTKTERLQRLAEITASRESISVDSVFENWKKDIPAGRFAEASEIAELVLFLASEKASYINGVSIPIDGGRLWAIS